MEIVESVLSGKYEKIVAPVFESIIFFWQLCFPDPIDSLKDSLDMC